MNRLHALFLTFALALLTACGGGGSSSSPAATPTPPVAPVAPLSTAKVITAFSVASVQATINEASKTIDVTLPAGTNLRALVATFTSTGSSVKVGILEQTSGNTANDFTNAVTYTVTAADGSTSRYSASVTLAPSSTKSFTSFSLAGVPGLIDEAARTVSVTLPYGTLVNPLVATFASTGVSVLVGGNVQTSNQSANNFSSPVSYTLKAADGSSASYSVRVTVALNSAKQFNSFGLWTSGITLGVIDEAARTILVTVPYGTSPAALKASFTATSLQVSVGGAAQSSDLTINNFSTPVVYTLTAQDGSTARYTVTVAVAPPKPLAVQSTLPAGAGSSAGSPTAAIVAGFTKALNPATCTAANFKLSGGATGTVSCTGSSISFTPGASLALGSTYTATLTTGLKDVEGVSLTADYAWTFKTRTEYVAPSVIGGSYGSGVVKLEFSEAMNTSTVNTSTISLSPATPGTVSTNGQTASFTPTAALTKGATYTVTVAGAQDVNGNALSPSYSWSFATDPGSVVPIEYYSGLNCVPTTKSFSVEAVNETGYNQDVKICIHNAAVGYATCGVYTNIPPGGNTPISKNPYTNEWHADFGVCYSSGQYTLTWTRSAGPASTTQTGAFTSTNWVATVPKVDPCFLGGAIKAPNCVSPFASPPVVSTPTAPATTTYPVGSTVAAETSPDADGCYVPQHAPECLVIEKLAFSAYTAGQVNMRLRNNCARRVYAGFCLQHNDGSWDCGADGASPGGAITWWSYGANGQATYQYTGSTNWQNDWVCRSRDPNLRAKFP